MDKRIILDFAKKYIDSKKTEKFVAGKTYVKSSGAMWDGDDISAVVNASLDAWITDGKEVREFEKTMSTTFKQRHSVFCNSGSSANLLALSALTSSRLGSRAIKPGDEVITVGAGFPTTVNPILQNKLVPVFVDVSLPSYNALPHAIEEAVSHKTKAIMIAHTLGNPFKAQEVRDIADRNELWVIADCCFVAGTKIKTNKGDVPIEKIKNGDMVLTRKGYRKVVGNEKTGVKKIITRLGLTGTPDHPVITKSGIKRLDALSTSDIIYTCSQKQSSITELSIQEYQILQKGISGFIIGDAHHQEKHLFTGKNILNSMEKYLRGLTFTTLTEIHSTMIVPILRQFPRRNTQEYISRTMEEMRLRTAILNWQEKRPSFGTKTLPIESFTSELRRSLGKISQLIQQFVRFAGKNIKLIFHQDQKIVQEPVKAKAEVYNLRIEGEHEYFANDILVHNCDALGTTHLDAYVQAYADISTVSLYPAHHISAGEGGIVSTNNPMLNKIIKSFRDWGRDCWCDTGKDNTCGKRFGWKLGDLPEGFDHKYIYSEVGYNLKATELQAALGLSQIKKLPRFIDARRKTWQFYRDAIGELEEFFILPEPTLDSNPSWFGFMLSVREDAPFSRNDMVKYLEENKIGSRMLFGGNLTKQPAYANQEYRISGTLHKSDFVMNNGFWIGVSPVVTPEMREYVAEKIFDFCKEKAE